MGASSEGLLSLGLQDPKWCDTKWTVYRGVAYDLTEFLERHPGGNWLVNLAVRLAANAANTLHSLKQAKGLCAEVCM